MFLRVNSVKRKEAFEEKPFNRFFSTNQNYKLIQKTLLNKSNQMEELVNNTPDLICCFNKDKVLTLANNSYCKYFNADRDTLIGKDFFKFIPKEDHQKVHNHFLSLNFENPIATHEHKVIDSNGNIRWQQWTNKAIYNEDGELVEYQSFGKDITEQKRAIDQLKESEEKYRLVTENIPVAVYSFFPDKKPYNPFLTGQVDKITGYSRQDFSENQKLWISLIHPYDREYVISKLRFHRTMKKALDIVFRIISRDEKIKWIRERANCILDAEQNLIRVDGFIEDVTKHREAVLALRESEKMFRSLVDTMKESAMIVDPDYTILFCNEALRQLLEADSSDEIIGKKTIDFVDDDFKEKTIQKFEGLISNFKRESLEDFRISTLKGKVRWVEALAAPILYKGKTAILVTTRDMTRRKESEAERERLREQLEQKKIIEAIGQMAGGVAHDLNNVLGGIVSYPDFLLLDLPEDSPFRKPLEEIRTSGKKAAAIVGDMMTIVRTQAAKKETININSIIEEQLNAPEMELLKQFHPDVGIHTSFASGLHAVTGSEIHVAKIIMNLVSNAAEAMPDGGIISVTTENKELNAPFISGCQEIPPGNYVLLKVSDTGCGMEEEDISRIFEPFYTKKKMGRSGTGLGMAVVWEVIQDHKGYINIKSKPGKGTDISIYLPATEDRQHQEIPSPHPHAHYRGNGERILVVDDDERMRELSLAMLERLGYQACVVSSGEEAIEYLKDKPVDLVLLDMIMYPGIDGLETYRQMLEIRPEQKTLVVSGYSEGKKIEEMQKLGVNSFLLKPFFMKDLGKAVKDELS